MNTGMGIVIMVVCAIGLASILLWGGKQARRIYHSSHLSGDSSLSTQ